MPTDQEERRRGWRRSVLVALLVAALVLVGAGGAGFAAGRVIAGGGDGPVRCASWSAERCIPGLDLDDALATLVERGFDCERQEWPVELKELHGIPSEDDTCTLGRYRATFTSRNGQVSDLAAAVPAQPDVSLTPYQAAFLSWVVVLPFAGQPASAETASNWLGEQLAGSVDVYDYRRDTNIDGYDYGLGRSLRDNGVIVLEVRSIGDWFR